MTSMQAELSPRRTIVDLGSHNQAVKKATVLERRSTFEGREVRTDHTLVFKV